MKEQWRKKEGEKQKSKKEGETDETTSGERKKERDSSERKRERDRGEEWGDPTNFPAISLSKYLDKRSNIRHTEIYHVIYNNCSATASVSYPAFIEELPQ